jgi:hypothetical protein
LEKIFAGKTFWGTFWKIFWTTGAGETFWKKFPPHPFQKLSGNNF